MDDELKRKMQLRDSETQQVIDDSNSAEFQVSFSSKLKHGIQEITTDKLSRTAKFHERRNGEGN